MSISIPPRPSFFPTASTNSANPNPSSSFSTLGNNSNMNSSTNFNGQQSQFQSQPQSAQPPRSSLFSSIFSQTGVVGGPSASSPGPNRGAGQQQEQGYGSGLGNSTSAAAHRSGGGAGGEDGDERSSSPFAQSALPELIFNAGEIETRGDGMIGRGKGIRQKGGAGHSLFSIMSANSSSLEHSITRSHTKAGPSYLTGGVGVINGGGGSGAGADAGAGAEVYDRPRRRKRQTPASRGAESFVDLNAAYTAANGDMNAWGRSWHEMVILSGIEKQRQNTISAFNQQFQQRMSNNWEEEKKKVLQNELGVAQDETEALGGGAAAGGLGSSVLGSSVLARSTLGQSTRKFPLSQSTTLRSAESQKGDLAMQTRLLKYAQVVENLNKNRIAKRPVEICHEFEYQTQGDTQAYASTAFKILSHIVQEPSVADPGTPATAISERQFAQAYLEDVRSVPKRKLNERLAQGGRRYLERDFEQHMDETVARNPKEAALGGTPGILNKVRGFVSVLLSARNGANRYNIESVAGIPLYAQVYHLLRSGHSTEAIALLAQHQDSIKREDAVLPGALKTLLSSPDRRLPRGMRDQLLSDFNANVKSNPGVDQFKYALYKIIGRFELGRKVLKVAESTEDWIWAQLMMIRETGAAGAAGGGEDGPSEKYDLADFGQLVQGYKSDKFDQGGSKPWSWVTLLLFAGEFESAVAYLWIKKQTNMDAVHLAVALSYYGLLRIPDSPEDQLCLTRDTGFERKSWLNFYRIVKAYIAPLYQPDPKLALQYAYLVALNSDVKVPQGLGQQQQQLALELVRDVVLASRQWGELLGSVQQNGTKRPGVIERDIQLLHLPNNADSLHAVILSAAEQSNVDASLVDSVELYHLAGATEKVVDSVTRALALSLSQYSSSGSSSLGISSGQRLGLSGVFGGVDGVYTLAQRVMGIYERDLGNKRGEVESGKWELLEVLMRLKKGMGEFEADRPDLALETFRASNVLPLDPSTTDPISISRYAHRFTSILDTPAVSDLDSVVITTMKCIWQLSEQLKKSPYGDAGRASEVNRLKTMAMGLIQFASGLRLRLGGDVYRQLSSLSAFL